MNVSVVLQCICICIRIRVSFEQDNADGIASNITETIFLQCEADSNKTNETLNVDNGMSSSFTASNTRIQHIIHGTLVQLPTVSGANGQWYKNGK